MAYLFEVSAELKTVDSKCYFLVRPSAWSLLQRIINDTWLLLAQTVCVQFSKYLENIGLYLPASINLFLKQNKSSVSIFAFMQCLSRQRMILQSTRFSPSKLTMQLFLQKNLHWCNVLILLLGAKCA